MTIRPIRQAMSHAAPHHFAPDILHSELQNPASGANGRLSFAVVSRLLQIRFHNRKLCQNGRAANRLTRTCEFGR